MRSKEKKLPPSSSLANAASRFATASTNKKKLMSV